LKALEGEAEGFNCVADRNAEMESLLAHFMGEIGELKEKLTKLEEEKEEWKAGEDFKAKYESLAATVEPFKEQLEEYEAEKAALLTVQNVTAEKMKELAIQHGKALGHQNHKQKINHLVKVKTENVALQQENAELKTKLAKITRTVARLETKAVVANKENAGEVFATPAAEASTVTASTRASSRAASVKRVAVAAVGGSSSTATPLSSRNRR